jgi:hypothetical protein
MGDRVSGETQQRTLFAWTRLTALLLSLVLAWATGSPSQEATPPDLFQMTTVKESGFPLNVDPKIVGAAEAALGDGDMVMGIVIEGEARAYPVNYMSGPYNEVVNDTLGARAITASW